MFHSGPDKGVSLSFNERRLIELIFRNGSVARTEIAALAGMTGASVTRIVAKLIDDGLVRETVDRHGSQGQPRRPLTLVPGRSYSAGVNFTRHWLDLAVLDLAGTVVAVDRTRLPAPEPEAIAQSTRLGLQQILERSGLVPSDLVGFGVSVPTNFHQGSTDLAASPYFPNVSGRDFVDSLKTNLGGAVHFENDGSCAALGEFMFGAGRGIEILFLMHIGHGVGGGGIIEGRLYRGAHGNACLPGALYPMDQPRPSGQDLLDGLARDGHRIADFNDLPSAQAADADLAASIARWTARAAGQLKLSVAMIRGLFDPHLILLGGRLPGWLNEDLVRLINADDLAETPDGLPNAPVVAAANGPMAGAIGAACLPLFAEFFSGAIADSYNNYRNGRRPAVGSQ